MNATLRKPGMTVVLLAVAGLSYLLLLYPGFYGYDSAELTVGAATLGLVHAPGYALYLLSAHVLTLLPFGEIGWRVNLFSAVCMVASAPFLSAALTRIAQNRTAALATTGFFLWTFSSWNSGTIAEVYAPQVLTLTFSLYALTRLAERRTTARVVGAAASYGIAVAMHPSSVFFAPAVALAFVGLRIPARQCLGAGLLALALFAAPLVYFPLRQQFHPALDLAGTYSATGAFERVNLGALDGLWWLLSGRQFASLFFTNGAAPTLQELGQTAVYLWTNLLGIGMVLGLVGLVVLGRRRRRLLLWLAAFVPYTYFYTVYGALDRETMLGPSYLLWCVPLCLGLRALESVLPREYVRGLVLIALIPLALNLPLLLERNRVSTRAAAQSTLDALPKDATVFGLWNDLMPVQYLQIVEGQRGDLDLRNLILFDSRETAAAFVSTLLLDPAQRPIIFLGSGVPAGLDTRRFDLVPFRAVKGGSAIGYEVRRR